MLYIDCSSRLNAAVSIAGHVTGVLKGLITIAVYVSFLFFLIILLFCLGPLIYI